MNYEIIFVCLLLDIIYFSLFRYNKLLIWSLITKILRIEKLITFFNIFTKKKLSLSRPKFLSLTSNICKKQKILKIKLNYPCLSGGKKQF